MTRLEIISDPVCPWCYIGTARFFQAAEARGGSPFTVRWRPFQLDPDIPLGGLDRGAWLRAKFGDDDAVARAHETVLAAAAEAGLAMDLARMVRAPNTFDAHRLLHWAEAEGLQTPVARALFHLTWVAGADIGDAAVLADAASGAGMDRDVVARLLAGDADRAEVAAEIAAIRGMGVTGVPTFLIAGTYAVPGAQSATTWTRIMDEIEAAADAGADIG